MTPFRRLLGYVLRYRRDFVFGLICSVTTTSITLASPKILRYAVDDLTPRRHARQAARVRRRCCWRLDSSAACSASSCAGS